MDSVTGVFVSEGAGGSGYDRTYTFEIDDEDVSDEVDELCAKHFKDIKCSGECAGQPAPLPAPENLVVASTGEGDSLQLTWDNPATDASSIEYQEFNPAIHTPGTWTVFADEAAFLGDAVEVKLVNAAKYTVGSTWQFRIRARRNGLNLGDPTVISDWSNIDSATVT